MKYKDQMKKMRDGPSKVCLEIGSLAQAQSVVSVNFDGC